MRTILRLPVASCAIALLASAGRAEDLEASLRAKLARPFARNAAWVLDYDKALEAAKRSNRLVFAYFTRSYQP